MAPRVADVRPPASSRSLRCQSFQVACHFKLPETGGVRDGPRRARRPEGASAIECDGGLIDGRHPQDKAPCFTGTRPADNALDRRDTETTPAGCGVDKHADQHSLLFFWIVWAWCQTGRQAHPSAVLLRAGSPANLARRFPSGSLV